MLELSLREARHLDHNFIGTGHILPGLVREGDGAGCRVLVGLGVDLSRVRQQVLGLSEGQLPPEAAETVGQRFGDPGDGPCRPTCRSRLAGNVGYRVLPVPAVGNA